MTVNPLFKFPAQGGVKIGKARIKPLSLQIRRSFMKNYTRLTQEERRYIVVGTSINPDSENSGSTKSINSEDGGGVNRCALFSSP